MASLEKIKEAIARIAQHRKTTSYSEIEWVMDQLAEHGYDVRKRKTRHGYLYGVNSHVRFQVCAHNPGSKHVKSCYVSEFLNKMFELGLYED